MDKLKVAIFSPFILIYLAKTLKIKNFVKVNEIILQSFFINNLNDNRSKAG
ncbi:hypothetical protein [Enterococcus villorum]|uniref:Uncharacterized protein n=1 Tax=Enterococcus villorum TaxID=112904 RepID=A0A511J3P8_9ENTE|nr:hypothetical protein EVI01_19590 [Enterococcus villorum]